jgi:signal transduction histidine kinase
VRDEGIGIHRKAHQKIFGIFERGLTSDVYEGTGIGLAIVARAMQRMGGTCGVESEPGQGSQFWLELPAP